MILGGDRLPVIENIRKNAESGNFHSKVEINDPILSTDEAKNTTNNYLLLRNSMGYKFKSFFARLIANIGGSLINKDTEIVGNADTDIFKGGVIITSNHFSPLENTVIREFARKKGGVRMSVVSQVTNFAMGGLVGFLMKYADTIPLSFDARYIARDLIGVLKEKLNKGEAILIYPEQEMWFNYRKPRPHKEGAYHFAAKLNRPIISCFVEIIDKEDLDRPDFHKTKYRLHILGVIYPDESKTVKENCKEMCEKDYEMKKNAYESIYKKPLSYDFEYSDIAGWINNI